MQTIIRYLQRKKKKCLNIKSRTEGDTRREVQGMVVFRVNQL